MSYRHNFNVNTHQGKNRAAEKRFHMSENIVDRSDKKSQEEEHHIQQMETTEIDASTTRYDLMWNFWVYFTRVQRPSEGYLDVLLPEKKQFIFMGEANLVMELEHLLHQWNALKEVYRDKTRRSLWAS